MHGHEIVVVYNDSHALTLLVRSLLYHALQCSGGTFDEE